MNRKKKGKRTGSDSWVEDFKYQNQKVIKTKYGDTTVQYFDLQQMKRSKSLLDTINKYSKDRYTPREDAQKILDSLPKQKKSYTEEEQLYTTNRDGINEMRKINCFECSMAYEMRMRGYDVQSKEMNGGFVVEAKHAFAVTDYFNIKLTPSESSSSDKQKLAEKAYEQMEQECLKYGEGARGCLGIQYYDYDAGHSMFWEVKDGEFRILDAQRPSTNGYETFLHADAEKGIQIDRLDNAEVLPGIVDFVEPYALLPEEIAEQEKIAEKKAEKLKVVKQKANKNKAEKLKNNEEKNIKAMDKRISEGRNFVEKAIHTIGNTAKNIIKSGKNAVLDLINPQYVEFGGHKFKKKRT